MHHPPGMRNSRCNSSSEQSCLAPSKMKRHRHPRDANKSYRRCLRVRTVFHAFFFVMLWYGGGHRCRFVLNKETTGAWLHFTSLASIQLLNCARTISPKPSFAYPHFVVAIPIPRGTVYRSIPTPSAAPVPRRLHQTSRRDRQPIDTRADWRLTLAYRKDLLAPIRHVPFLTAS